MKKIVIMMLPIVVLLAGAANVEAASFNFKLGLFYPNMKSDLWEINMENLALSKQDMQDKYYAGEFEQFVGRNLSLTLEVGHYMEEHYSMYRDYEYDDGTPIYQNVALRVINMEAGFKFYPLGHRGKLSPFVGAGFGMYYWKFEQWGDFIDFVDDVINQDVYAESHAFTPGFNAKGGFVYRPSRSLGIGVEARYQNLKGELGSFFEGFEKLDMSGMSYALTIHLFFR